MLRKILRAKIHRATVTDANKDYVGSITIDQNLMDAVGLAEGECVLVADLDNGTRHETYTMAGERGSGVICINGAAAHLVDPGHLVIIMCFGYAGDDELADHRPKIALVDEKNRLAKMI